MALIGDLRATEDDPAAISGGTERGEEALDVGLVPYVGADPEVGRCRSREGGGDAREDCLEARAGGIQRDIEGGDLGATPA